MNYVYEVKGLENPRNKSLLHVTVKQMSLSCLQKNVHSSRFVCYICDKVLPELDSIKGEDESVDLKLEVLKLFAEMAGYMGEIENINDRLEKLFARLLVRFSSTNRCGFNIDKLEGLK